MKTIGCFRHLLLLYCLFYGNLLTAQTTWTGAVNSNWTFPPNWTAGVPDANDDVVIPNVVTPPVINGATNNAMANSIHLQPSAKLTIFPGGQLFVDGAFGLSPNSTWAIFNQGTIENSGNLNILPSPTPRRTGLKTYGTFKNLAGGEVNVAGYTNRGIDNNGLLENFSKIYIAAGPANAYGFGNTSTFLNHVCATFHSVETVQTTTSSFNNIGHFRIDDATPFDNGGNATNSGILKLPQAEQFSPSSANVINNEIIVSPTSFSGCGPVSPSLLLGGFIDYTVDGIFSDAAATVSAGTYDINTNTFTPNPILGTGVHTLYFKISINNCTHIVSWRLTILPLTNCPTGTRTWTGTVNNDWNNACNWSPQCVPTANDAVVINNVANDPVINTANAVALSVTMFPGALLTIQNTGQLDINNSAPFDGIILQGATVINQGTLNIGQNGNNIARHGILMIFNTNNSVFNNDGGVINIDNTNQMGFVGQHGANFTNQNNGQLNIGQNGNIGVRGIFFFASTLTNDGSTINVDRTGSFGIDMTSNSNVTNQNNGQINIGQNANIGALGFALSSSALTNDGSTINIDRTASNGFLANPNSNITNQNNGQINIGQNDIIGGVGIFMGNATLTNDGATINIDRTASDGIEQNPGAIFENKNGGQVNIGQTGNIGRYGILSITSTFSNDGANIDIDNTSSDGIRTQQSSNLINQNNGQVNIGQNGAIGGSGILAALSSTCTNNGSTLNIGNTQLFGIVILEASFFNENNGQINIGQTGNIGNIGLKASASTFSNNRGTVNVDRTTIHGIEVEESMFENKNAGIINIGQTGNIGESGINAILNSTFSNDGATINIDRTTKDGVTQVSGSSFENKNGGQVNVGQTGSIGQFGVNISMANTTFTNDNATLKVDRTTLEALFLNLSASFININAGKVLFGQTFPIGRNGISQLNSSSITNNGATMKIDRTTNNGIVQRSNSSFTNNNNGHLGIGQTGNIGGVGWLASNGIISNDGATFAIDQTIYQAIFLEAYVNFENKNNAQVHIGQTANIGSHGIGARLSTVTNDNSTFRVDRTFSDGILIAVNSILNNQNNGQLLLGQTALINDDGVEINSNCTFNNDNANLIINNTNGDGLKSVFNSTVNNRNSAKITIGPSLMPQSSAIDNWNTFNNFECAIVEIYDDLDNTDDPGNPGSIFNNGLFRINTNQPSNAGNFNNNGLLEIVQLPLVPITVNNGIVVAPTVGECTDISPAFSLPGPGQFINLDILGVFTDASATQPAGTYNVNTNTFTPNSLLAEGSMHTFYVKIEYVDFGCSRILAWNLTIDDVTPPTFTCPTAQVVNTNAGACEGSVPDLVGMVNDASDNCGAVALGQSVPVNTIFMGQAMITITADDGNGNQNAVPCVVMVTVTDNEPPVAICPASIPDVALDPNGNGTLQANIGDGSSTDNCSVVETSPQLNFTCAELGQKVVTLTASDGTNSVTTNCSFNVVDNTAPVAVCPSSIPNVVLDASGNGTLPANIGDGSSTDNCSVIETSPQLNFTCDDLGQKVVTLTASDGTNSVTTNCSFNVVDNTAPVAVCPSSIPDVVLDASGNGTLPANIGDGSSTDNCSVIETSPQLNFTCADLGQKVVTLTASDGTNSVTANCTFNVVDNTAPVAVCPSSIPDVALDANGNGMLTADIGDGSSMDNCSILETSPMVNFTCSDLGQQVVTLTATDGTNSVTTNCSFNVVDNEKPMAICQTTTVYLDANGIASIIPADVDGGSSDNCGFTLSLDDHDFSCADIPSENVILTATDESGNSHSCSALINIMDNVNPNAVCQNTTVQLNADGMAELTVSQIENGSSDACGIANRILDITSFDCGSIGDNPVVLTVTDGNGNSSSCTATVTVEDNISPSVFCQDISIQLDETGNAIIAPSDVFAGGNDNCSSVNLLSVSPNQFACPSIGANMVALTVDDGHGNSSACSATVTVEEFFTSLSTSTTPETCGLGNGSIIVSATALGGQLSYSIDGGATWQNSNTFNGLSAGIYEVTVQANGTSGCSVPTATVEIGQEGSLTIWYKDIDGDGFTDGVTLTQCAQPSGFVANALPGDCNDYDANEHPGQEWFEDIDGDGYGTGSTIIDCSRPTGYYLSTEMNATSGDCNDSDPSVHPEAIEICNGIDDDCDGEVDENTSGGLTYVGNINFTNQTQVDDFSQCYSIIDGNLTIQNSGVNDLSNLSNLTEVTGNVYIKSTGLSDLTGLESLTDIGGYLRIQTNNSLTTLDGVENVVSVGAYLRVYYNSILTDCCAIHELLENGGVGGSIIILRNDTGCDSVAEIENNCAGGNNLVAPTGNEAGQACSDCGNLLSVNIYPNPVIGTFNMVLPEHEGANFIVSDLTGKSIFSGELENGITNIEVDTHNWRAGVYIIFVKIKDKKLVSKRLTVIR